ncbi:MAG: carboxypeptidase regulatory-like domain-containing protein [Planctomycetes bacterium]|nr:carboxypeptidase regulatory-like domain-containing protein [Planctomycetota bacterium]
MRTSAWTFGVVAIALAVAATWILRGDEATPDPGRGEVSPITVADPAAATPRSGSSSPSEVVHSTDQDRSPASRDEFRARLAEMHVDRGIGGIVLAPDGTPFGGALVWLLHPTDEDALDTRTSDARGHFVFPVGLDADDALLSFRIAAHLPDHGIADPIAAARPGPGEITLVTVTASRALGSVTGRVVGPGGRPVPDHVVLLVRSDASPGNEPEWRAGRDDAEVRTAADGSFVARGLRIGTFEVDVAPRDQPAGFLVEPPEERPLLATGAPPATIVVPWTRVDLVARGIEGVPVAADGFALSIFAESIASLAAARFAAGQPIEAQDVAPTAERELRLRGERASFWVAPGCFVIGEIDDGPRRAHAGALVPKDVAVFELPVGSEGGEPATVVLRVHGDDGTKFARVLVRISGSGGVAFVPAGFVDHGAGHVALPEDGRLTLPASIRAVSVLAEPLRAGSRPLADAWLPAELTLALAPGKTVERDVALARAAVLEFDVACEASLKTGAEPELFAGRIGDVAVLRARAHLERTDDELEPLLIGMRLDDDSWAELAGLPWRSGATTQARVLSALRPGRVAFTVATMRADGAAPKSRRLFLDLVPGTQRIRLRIDADLVAHAEGR